MNVHVLAVATARTGVCADRMARGNSVFDADRQLYRKSARVWEVERVGVEAGLLRDEGAAFVLGQVFISLRTANEPPEDSTRSRCSWPAPGRGVQSKFPRLASEP
jgi:hypothetical protein